MLVMSPSLLWTCTLIGPQGAYKKKKLVYTTNERQEFKILGFLPNIGDLNAVSNDLIYFF